MTSAKLPCSPRRVELGNSQGVATILYQDIHFNSIDAEKLAWPPYTESRRERPGKTNANKL